MITWKLQKFLVKNLKEYSKNPRKLSKFEHNHLTTSISKFGLIDKPVVTPDGQIIGGHQRKKILKSLGIEEVECWTTDEVLDEKQIEELNVRLNKNQGEWDMDILSTQFDKNDLLNWGFNEDELPDIEEIESIEEDGEVLEPGEDADALTELGDIFELNSHRVVCGDSTMPEVVEKCLDGNEPMLMVTDPPYGVNYDPKWRKDIKGKHGVAARATGTVSER